MGGRIFIQKLGVFGIKQYGALSQQKFGAHIGADGSRQLFQPGGRIGRGAHRKHLQRTAVGEQVAAQRVQRRAESQSPQAAAVVKSRAVQHPHRIGQGYFLHKAAGHSVAIRLAGYRPVGKTIGADFHHRRTVHKGRHHRAGAVAQYLAQTNAARAGLGKTVQIRFLPIHPARQNTPGGRRAKFFVPTLELITIIA